MRNAIVILILLMNIGTLNAQHGDSTTHHDITFLIHEEVTNADGPVEQELIALWQNYIKEGNFQDAASPYWSFEQMTIPDENFWAVGIPTLTQRAHPMQCKIIGIYKDLNEYWRLISSFSHVDEEGEIHLDVITSVYAKEINGKYLLISNAEFLKTVFEHRTVGNINYYIHPFHTFVQDQADEMNAFNIEMAELFQVEPLSFDYFVASNARDIARTWGYEYMNRMYNPSGKGGIASWRNMIIYSGNNSSFFPHELVHLYTYHVVPKDPHFWVGEGIATYFAGTSTYTYDGHMLKLQEYLKQHPDFDLSDITTLNKTIPNGEHKSDLRYVIGALLMGNIYKKEGIPGLLASLQYGTSDEDFFRLLKDKLNITPDQFDSYVKEQARFYQTVH